MTADVLTWHVWLDWNNDGVFESDEGEYLVAPFHSERGQDLALSDPMAGQCTLTFDNSSRRYDWWWSGSPIYPNSLIGKHALITVELDGVTYNLFDGWIDVPAITGIRGADPQGGGDLPTATLTLHDGWQWLKDKKALIALQTNITIKAAIQQILDAVGWAQDAAALVWDVGEWDVNDWGGLNSAALNLGVLDGDVLPYWWSQNEPADANLMDLARAHFARVWIGADGKFNFRLPAEDNGAADDFILTDAVIQEMLIYQRLDELANKISVSATPYKLLASAEIWQMGEVLLIPAGESKTFYTQRASPATGQITPAATTDFTANGLEDGSGLDYTASFTAALTILSSFDEKIVITNTGGVSAYLTLLKLRGQTIEAQDGNAQIAEDVTSQQTYAERPADYVLRWQQNTLIASDLANFVLDARKNPRSNLQIQMEHRIEALAYDLGIKILDSTTRGLTGSRFRLGKIVHDCADPGMQNLVTQWSGYPAESDAFLIWDIDAWDTRAWGV